jgi:predicted adenine nucleotide alpha hydrolase (AANH) superfamily ATPase
MNKRNFSAELEKLLEGLEARKANLTQASEPASVPTLLLHSCCAPCSSYVMEYLAPYFSITVLYYNPNIDEEAEYRKRAAEEKRLIDRYNEEKKGYPITYVDGRYDPQEFYAAAAGLEDAPEGGPRCFRCYELRLRETARMAAEQGADYFCTTLSISPLKNAEKINEIGERIAAETGVKWLPSDFKKKDGYKRSIELSKEYELYRQNYCGCSFSKASSSCAKCAAGGTDCISV